MAAKARFDSNFEGIKGRGHLITHSLYEVNYKGKEGGRLASTPLCALFHEGGMKER